MVSPISLEEIEKYAENVYEAIMIIAKRARQINDEQKRIVESQIDTQDDTEENFDDEVPEEIYDQSFVRLPKPTRVAMEEMLSGKLKFEYDEEQVASKDKADPEKEKK
jgi:DNA-directed RNA polymerase subunit K/omega